MISKLLKLIFRNFPVLKGKLWKFWYTYLGSKVITPELKFMNYGYFRNDFKPQLSLEDEKERYPIHLSHYLCSKSSVNNVRVLEVGCGRGGGAAYITRTFIPKQYHALDISPTAIQLCNNFYKSDNLSFHVGSADELPFDNQFFDVVINVESSHCYPNFNKFLLEVKRVLKSDGQLLITDFRSSSEFSDFDKLINENFEIISYEDITDNILLALDEMSEKRKKQIKYFLPNFLSNISSSFAGIKGSELYESFVNRELVYHMYVLKSI